MPIRPGTTRGNEPAHRTSRPASRDGIAYSSRERVSIEEKRREPGVLRELRIADISREAVLHTVRQSADAAIRAVICACPAAGDDRRKLGGWLVPPAQTSGNASVAFPVPGMAVAGPGERAVWVDAVSRSFTRLGVSRLAEDPQKEADPSEDQKLAQS